MNEEQGYYFEAMLKMMEEEFPYGPVYYRMAKNDNQRDEEKLEFDEAYDLGVALIEASIKNGLDTKAILDKLELFEALSKYPEVIKKLRENYRDE